MKSPKLYWQTDEYDCGVACAATLLSLHGCEVDYDDFRETFHIGTSGISLQQIFDKLVQSGATPEAFEVADPEDLDNSLLPCIATLEHHFVIVLGTGKRKVRIFDPTFGNLTLTRSEFKARFTGYILKVKDGLSSAPASSPTRQGGAPFRLEARLLKKNSLLLGTSAVVISSINLGVPYLVDGILSAEKQAPITRMALALLSVKLALVFMEYLSKWLVLRMEIKLAPSLIQRYLTSVERMPFFSFSSRSIGDYISRFHDMNQVGNLFNAIFNGIVTNGLVFAISLTALFLFKPSVALWIFAFSTLLLFLYRVHMPGIRSIRYYFDLESNKLNTLFSDFIGNFEFLTSASVRKRFREQIIDEQLTRQAVIKRTLGLRTFRFGFLLELFELGYSFEVIFLILLFSGYAESPTFCITLGFYFSSILNPMMHILNTYSDFIEFRLKARRIDNILATSQSRIRFEIGQESPDLFRADSMGLDIAGKSLFTGTTIHMKRGEKVGIFGRSGVGKTSLLRILCGLIRNTQGQIVFSKDLSKDGQINQVLYVPQNPQISRGVLREYFRDEIANHQDLFMRRFEEFFREEILQSSSEELLNAQVSPSGGLSRGQVQRAVILKSLFDTSLLKLYDEPTANLDSGTAKIVLDAIFSMDCATLVVSHDRQLNQLPIAIYEMTPHGMNRA